MEPAKTAHKLSLWAVRATVVPEGYLAPVEVERKESYEGEVIVEANVRTREGSEFCLPRAVLTLHTSCTAVLPSRIKTYEFA